MNEKSIDKLIVDNLPLINLCIKKMNLFWATEDERQEYYDNGLLGLINGAKEYNETKGKPSTFLYTCISNMIKRGIYLKHMPKRFNPLGKNISLSLEIIDNGNKAVELEETIPDDRVNIENEVEKHLDSEKLLLSVNQLKNETDKLAVKMYFGLEGYQPSTYEKVGEIFGFSRERARQRIVRALPKIRKIYENQKEVFMIEKNMSKEYKSSDNLIEQSTVNDSRKNNTLVGLNDILFNQLNALNSATDDKDFEKEIRKSYAVSQLAQQIVANTNTCIKALKVAKEQNIDSKELNLIGIGNNEK